MQRDKVSKSLAARLPEGALAGLAARIAPRPSPSRHPGWHFDTDAEDRSFATTLRREIWRAYRQRRIERPLVVPWYRGTRLALHLGNDLSKCVYIGGEFEPNEFSLIAELLDPGMTFLDVGANEGVYTIFASTCVGTEGRVIAIEPSSREQRRLRANLQLNAIENVTVLEAAAGAADGSATLAIAERGHEGQNTVGTRVANPKVVTERVETVRVRSIDSVVSDEHLTRLDFVKIDAEGSELSVLQGAERTLATLRPLVQLEVEPDALAAHSTAPADVEQALLAHGYALWGFDPATGLLRRSRDDGWGGNVIAAPSGWTPPGSVSSGSSAG